MFVRGRPIYFEIPKRETLKLDLRENFDSLEFRTSNPMPENYEILFNNETHTCSSLQHSSFRTTRNLGKRTTETLRSTRDYTTEKSKSAYESGKEVIGVKPSSVPKISKPMTISKRLFGVLEDGTQVHEFRLIRTGYGG